MASVRAAKNQLTTPTQHSRFELGVCMAVYSWENLTVAVQSGWGGPDSADKRDWLTGSIVELYETHDEVDSEDIENRLLQVMEDEFEVSIEDDSAYGVAEQIVKIFTQCKESDFSLVDSLYQKYTARQNSRSTSAPVQIVEQPEVSDDDDY
ncbi:Pre-rRNA-processing protein TSR2-domain-containing protein [Kockiozyma suomiensis]|uniref:Pre-rRNA-processing protein TSR2-domain-containing protein n=1 Tax=Kockiozyma suomiensis TaxID=1337062 RepID=UPI0033439F24